MEVIYPEVKYAHKAGGMAPRPANLEAKVLAMFQNHGSTGLGEGEVHREYPYVQLANQLKDRYGVGDILWYAKPMLSMVAPAQQRDEILARADVIINGIAG